MFFVNRIKKIIRNNRHLKFIYLINVACKKFLHSFYNEEFYNFQENGESFVLKKLKQHLGDKNIIVWDVGANHGQYAQEVHNVLNKCSVTSFEIIPEIAKEISEVAKNKKWWNVEHMGMSNKIGYTEVIWNRDNDDTSSINPDLEGHLFISAKVDLIKCNLTTISQYWKNSGVCPDFIKIDVEGHDWAVLEGAKDLLESEHAPVMIQFEYGRTWIPSQRMLGPVQKQLESYGYLVGRLYPNYVDFKHYDVSDEHFRMGNMIAVRNSNLSNALSR